MADGWADSEVERTLDAYFAMFRLELNGRTLLEGRLLPAAE